jgi:hypothetical protein
MNCISSPALDDAQVISYVEGEADESVVAHMQECPFCREKASRWAHLQNRLKDQLYRVSCPAPMELGEYRLGLLPAPQVLVVAQHLRECPLCRREVADLDEFLAEPGPQNNLIGTIKVLVAQLMHPNENGYRPASMALRGEAKGPITLKADGVTINLELQPAPHGQVSLLGQMAADDQDQWTGATVELQQIDAPSLTASMDDLGAFRFAEVRPGMIDITIKSLYGIYIQIPNVDIAI